MRDVEMLGAQYHYEQKAFPEILFMAHHDEISEHPPERLS
jgi:hypothetical protein